MIIKRKSELTGKEREMELPVTQEQLDKYASGKYLLQDVFPNLTPDQREFIKTGIVAEEWDFMFKKED